jgi:ribokinase
MSANKLMDAAFVDKAEKHLARSDIILSVLEIPVAAAARAMELGRKHGIRTLLNPAPATQIDGAVLRNVDYITPNETELRILLGLAPDDPTLTPDLARRLKARGANEIIVTMGENGALMLSGGSFVEIAGLKVDVVDTTGAGDAFSSALGVALTEGRSLIDAVRFANCAGALACTKLGVIPALAHRDAVDRLYAKHYT